MKKVLLVILSIAVVMGMTVTAFAALPDANSYAGENKPVKKTTDGGFYDIGTHEKLTIVAAASSGTVTEKQVDVDDDLAFETLQANSDKLNVTFTGAENGKFYVILLVEGNALPNDGNSIYYIDQKTATGTSVDFVVFPKAIDADKPTMTLFVTSSSGGTVASVAMGYCKSGTEHWIYNDGSAPAVKIGDLNNDGEIDAADRIILARHLADWAGYETLEYPDAADINKDGEVDAADRIILARYLAEWDGYDAYFE